MKKELAAIQAALHQIPNGTFEIQRHSSVQCSTPSLTQQLISQTQGKGIIQSYPLFHGVELSHHIYAAEQIAFHHPAKAFVLEIDHCHSGRVGWNMKEGAAVYLGTGDLCLHSMASCADSEMTLPLGYYEGISITVDLQQLETHCPALLQEAGLDPKLLFQKFCATEKPLGIRSNPAIDGIFSPLYHLPESLRLPYYKLKAQEALLHLLQLEPNPKQELTPYGSQQTQLIQEIRNFLVQHLDQRFTIETLSKTYHINTSSLKTIFKGVYGMPIASYVKEYRMQSAEKLLLETEHSIAQIAQQVGYESQGKFTKAFQQRTGILPTEYRRQHRREHD